MSDADSHSRLRKLRRGAPALTAASTCTRVPKSRVTLMLRNSALPSLTAAACRPLRVKMTASGGLWLDHSI